jgi:hypothetical protein
LGVSALPTVGQAHFLFAKLDPAAKTVAVGLTEHPTQDPVPLGARVPRVKAFSKSAASIALKGEGNWLKGTATDEVVGVTLDYGVLDKTDQGRGVFWLNYFAKTALSPAASQVKLGLPVELTFSKGADGKSVVTVYDDGKPAAASDVVIEEPDGTVAFEGKTNPDGTIAIPASSGLLVVRALVTDNVKGTHEGKAYDLVRSYCTLTVQTGAPAPVKPSGKSLTRMLSESFGDNHNIVSNTAFVNTLMNGKLTKEMAEHHFQQRALIHEACEKVILDADSSKYVPYGAEQKEVSVLLRKDLAAMGSSWPAASKAWPLTQKLIADIEDSAKNGPYFALGVWHVYYGGITHGGRDIGEIIGKVIKYEPTYYLKSDGYGDYAKKVNQITDPEARKEMIRGGQAAYRYIIASNDDPTFKK